MFRLLTNVSPIEQVFTFLNTSKYCLLKRHTLIPTTALDTLNSLSSTVNHTFSNIDTANRHI